MSVIRTDAATISMKRVRATKILPFPSVISINK